AIAKRAYREQRPVMDVALEDSGLSKADLAKLLDPVALTKGGIHGKPVTSIATSSTGLFCL
ncbi:MAG: hypothetical protein ABWY34_09885, partial [Pseudoxanthomonas sp.]